MRGATLARRLRERLRGASRPAVGSPPSLQTERPNTVDEWEREYLAPIEPVPGLANPIARIVAERTEPG